MASKKRAAKRRPAVVAPPAAAPDPNTKRCWRCGGDMLTMSSRDCCEPCHLALESQMRIAGMVGLQQKDGENPPVRVSR